MDNLRALVEHVIARAIPGDFIETGIWRGGACIFMRAILAVYGIGDRVVWCADSFEGLPEPNAAQYPADAGDQHHTFKQLAVSLDEVKANFARYGLLDDRVRFLKGWFKDTLPAAPIEKLAILRLDGDMYESTMDALNALYHKVVPGGAVIVDDFGAVAGCRKAIADFFKARAINEPIRDIDGIGAWWIKTT
jgi:Macrocin-O-methyltransferase (TylF)